MKSVGASSKRLPTPNAPKHQEPRVLLRERGVQELRCSNRGHWEPRIVDRIIGDQASHCNPPYAYVDVIHVWFQETLNARQVAWFRGQCGSSHSQDRAPWWDRSYNQEFRLRQPSKEALEFLARRNDVLLTYAELALDIIMDDEQGCGHLLDIFEKHYLQRWHGKRETKFFAGVGGRTAKGRSRGTTISWYADRPSKITGEVNCFHIEAQVQGSGALRRIGINHPRDLLSFDHAALWRRQLHNCFFQLDVGRLYRTWNNQHRGTRRRKPDVDKNGRNRDRAKGAVLFRAFGSLQALVDAVGRGPYLCKCARTTHPEFANASLPDRDVANGLNLEIAELINLTPEISYPYRMHGGVK